MMCSIRYNLTFYSDWHCGSGLAAGADVDLLVVKDGDGLPFVPGKTIKGLVREAAEQICGLTNPEKSETLKTLFGKEGEAQGSLFFGNAVIPAETREAIVESHTGRFLFRSVANTAIDGDGIAKDKSLRKMEVVVPCNLVGEIHFVDEGDKQLLVDALRMVKRLGQNRNRGLGRCRFSDFSVAKEGGDQ